ncbi:hypothetical protein FHETE_1901 [Fusarium heterosporum]|uniref:Uncharacterized protein n=1 Tax=Fusarium heterosporum TaxID=42747 RepID=A0A8H5X0R4_FUSHE|nr:hypothetical protein FHETE_1901 [Fusarium heterosporum]
MPQGTFSTRVQTAWDRVTRRRERQQPDQPTDAEEEPHRSQTRVSRIIRGASLPDLLDHAILNERPEWLPADTEYPSNYSLALSPSLDSGSVLTAFVDEAEQNPVHQERLDVPVVAVATSHTGSTTDDETPDPAWKIPGRESFPEHQTQGQKSRLGLFQSPRQMYRVKANGRVFMIPIDVFITQPG